ncbi:penicillin-binding protein, partial [Streptococcus thermophilus]
NPIDNIQNATNRRNTVLANMVDDEKLSQADADSAAGIDMASRLADTYQGTGDDYRYPSYFDAVIEEATKTYGLSEDEIVKNGYKIYTEMDAN